MKTEFYCPKRGTSIKLFNSNGKILKSKQIIEKKRLTNVKKIQTEKQVTQNNNAMIEPLTLHIRSIDYDDQILSNASLLTMREYFADFQKECQSEQIMIGNSVQLSQLIVEPIIKNGIEFKKMLEFCKELAPLTPVTFSF